MTCKDDFVTVQRQEFEQICAAMGISQQTAAMIGAEWERRTRREWAGCEPYIAIRPLREELKQQATTEAQRNGRVAGTAKKHGVSRATLYRWIKAARTSSRE